MSDTIAVPLDHLATVNHDAGGTGQPLCPACKFGRLHPYRVSFTLSAIHPYHGVDYLDGWVAVCVGNRMYNEKQREAYAAMSEEWDEIDDVEPCGFSMSMTPHRYPNR